MKQRLYLLAFFAISLALTSCKKDEEPAPIPEVVGKWSLDYGVLVSGFSNNPQDILVNGEKIDPASPYLLDFGLTVFPLSTMHIIESNKVFVNVNKFLIWVESYTGTWDYVTPKLTLKYDETNFQDEEYSYSVASSLPQLSINQTFTDSSGASAVIQWVYHK